MVADVTADFFGLMNETLFVYAAAALIVSFLLWEVPRSLRLFSEESIKNLYSDSSRLVNIGLFLFGLLIIGYMFMFENIPKIIKLLKIRGITSAVMIVVVVACFAAVFRFVQNTLKRTEGNSMGNFTMQTFLELLHTIFYISLIALAVPALAYLLFNGIFLH